jgi:hypothetical protein
VTLNAVRERSAVKVACCVLRGPRSREGSWLPSHFLAVCSIKRFQINELKIRQVAKAYEYPMWRQSVGEHDASTARCPTAARVRPGDSSSPATFNLKLIVNEKFGALSDRTGRPDEYPVIVLFGLAVRCAAVIEPPGGIPSPGTIDHPRVIQGEEKRVAIFGTGKSVGLLRPLPRDEFAFIFEKVRAGLEIDPREDAAAMNGRVANNDTTHKCVA